MRGVLASPALLYMPTFCENMYITEPSIASPTTDTAADSTSAFPKVVIIGIAVSS